MTSVVSFLIADKLNLYLNGLTIEWLNYQSTYNLPKVKHQNLASRKMIRFKFLL